MAIVSNAALADPGCMLCGGGRARPLWSKSGFLVVRCAGCGLVFVHPTPAPEALQAHYEAGYAAGSYQVHARAASLRRALFVRRLQQLERYGVRGRLLDVGCCTGLFLEVAAEAGWDVYGVEISAEAVRQAPPAYQDRIHRGPLVGAPFPEASFDLATMFDLIEHCPEPLTELRAAHRLLRDGGVLALTTPNISSWPSRLMGRSYSYLRPPDHLTYFSPTTIRMALARTGFEPLMIRRAPKTFSVEYLMAQMPYFNPRMARLLAPLARWLPERVRRATCSVSVGEMLVVAGKRAVA